MDSIQNVASLDDASALVDGEFVSYWGHFVAVLREFPRVAAPSVDIPPDGLDRDSFDADLGTRDLDSTFVGLLLAHLPRLLLLHHLRCIRVA